jgi:hypothetical protein
MSIAKTNALIKQSVHIEWRQPMTNAVKIKYIAKSLHTDIGKSRPTRLSKRGGKNSKSMIKSSLHNVPFWLSSHGKRPMLICQENLGKNTKPNVHYYGTSYVTCPVISHL